MIASYKRKSNIAARVIVFGILADIALVAMTQSKGPTWDVVAPAIGITCVGAYFVALWWYMKAKARSPAWVLLGGTLIGMVVVLCLKDRAKDGQPPKPPAPHEWFG